MEVKYRASKSRTQGRKGWCITFRHPLRADAHGKVGLKVRRGLGTTDELEANRLVEQMNELLGDEDSWNVAAREKAATIYDQRIVSAFFDEIEPMKGRDPWAIRDSMISLPKEEGYAKVLLLGTTGAGKTTLIRQLIGSHPEQDRFPSTSTSKTTVCDMEILLQESETYDAVVTFFPVEKVRSYIEECILNAGKANVNGEKEQDIIRHLLEHPEQRFRLSYLLGNLDTMVRTSTFTSFLTDDDSEWEEHKKDDDAAEQVKEAGAIFITSQEREQMHQTLERIIQQIKDDSWLVWLEVHQILGFEIGNTTEKEEEQLHTAFEECWKEKEQFHALVETILEEVEKRFSFVTEGRWEYNRSDWPESWSFSTMDRNRFVSVIRQMTSNYAKHFGRLVTPLVQGIRIRGPFKPTWWEGECPKLVLMDGEGLLHQAESNTSLPTRIIKRIEDVDAVLLVDSAKSPMQTAPVTILKQLASSGHSSKAFICLTHFDAVHGDNLPTVRHKKNHILGSLENGLHHISSILGGAAERSLRRHLTGRVFIVGGIQQPVQMEDYSTAKQLQDLLAALQNSVTPPEPIEAIPIYDGTMLVLNIQQASSGFHTKWDGCLGIRESSEFKKQHWTRIKALSRRLAEMGEDEYQELKPVADVITYLKYNLYRFVSQPASWKSGGASEELQQRAIDSIASELSLRIYKFAMERVWEKQTVAWMKAYQRSGKRSTRDRAHDLKQIYNAAMAIPFDSPAWVCSELTNEICQMVRQSVESVGGQLILSIGK